jgi:hypothetical protein
VKSEFRAHVVDWCVANYMPMHRREECRRGAVKAQTRA